MYNFKSLSQSSLRGFCLFVCLIKVGFHQDKKAKGMKGTRKGKMTCGLWKLLITTIHHFSGFPIFPAALFSEN